MGWTGRAHGINKSGFMLQDKADRRELLDDLRIGREIILKSNLKI
jgi:hypothetical protein